MIHYTLSGRTAETEDMILGETKLHNLNGMGRGQKLIENKNNFVNHLEFKLSNFEKMER